MLTRQFATNVDHPFLPPPDTVLDLPAPLSVNRTRKIDWKSKRKIDAWTKRAHGLVTMAWAGGRRPKKIPGYFEAIITLSNESVDLDNCPKLVIDLARRLELVSDDSAKYMRRVTLEFGEAPEGCRLILRPCEARP